MGTIISEVVRLALHGLVNDCLHVSPASTRSLAVALHLQHHNDATARQLERQRLAQSIWFTPSIRESLTRATSYTVPKIIVGQPPTANRQPPTANRQPPTAARSHRQAEVARERCDSARQPGQIVRWRWCRPDEATTGAEVWGERSEPGDRGDTRVGKRRRGSGLVEGGSEVTPG